MSEGFFDRWSRRKQEVREGQVSPEPAEPGSLPLPLAKDAGVVEPLSPTVVDPHPGLRPAGEVEVQSGQSTAEEERLLTEAEAPPLTLADAQALTLNSDFRPFVASHVAPEVKNAAFKKLFADPHFNVMDGLDVYIDDYSKPSPLPQSVLRQMVSAKSLKLFDEGETPADAGTPDVSQSDPVSESSEIVPSLSDAPAPAASQETDDHADLRLQPDDAAGAEDARRGTD